MHTNARTGSLVDDAFGWIPLSDLTHRDLELLVQARLCGSYCATGVPRRRLSASLPRTSARLRETRGGQGRRVRVERWGPRTLALGRVRARMTPSGEFHAAIRLVAIWGFAVQARLCGSHCATGALRTLAKTSSIGRWSGLESACGGWGPRTGTLGRVRSWMTPSGEFRGAIQPVAIWSFLYKHGCAGATAQRAFPPALGVGIHHRGPALDLAFGDATAPVDKAR